jgi:ParB family chromosome partitioning protein
MQPRDNVDAANIESLARSIRQSGLIQPIAVRAVSGRYEIIAGERRWLAAKSVGMTHIPAVVRDATDEEMLELALVENLQREDLNAIERASAYRHFCTRFNLKPDDIANRLGEDRTTVVNYLRLLDLPEGVRRLVADGKLTMGHARCLAGIPDDTERLQLSQLVVQKELSVRALEGMVRNKRRQPDGKLSPAGIPGPSRSAHVCDLERRFEEMVKTKVKICEGKRKGRGRIIIEYYSLDDFDRIASLFGVQTD